MYPDGRKEPPAERSTQGLKEATTHESRATPGEVIVGFHPIVGVVLEYLLTQEGYEVQARERTPIARSGPALVLFAAEDAHGLYVFKARDTDATLENLGSGDTAPLQTVSGIQAFVPMPCGTEDVLRVVRAAGGFDGRRRLRTRTV